MERYALLEKGSIAPEVISKVIALGKIAARRVQNSAIIPSFFRI